MQGGWNMDEDVSLLPNTVNPVSSLCLLSRIPMTFQMNDMVGTHDCQANTSRYRGHDDDIKAINGFELFYQPLPCQAVIFSFYRRCIPIDNTDIKSVNLV